MSAARQAGGCLMVVALTDLERWRQVAGAMQEGRLIATGSAP